MRIQQQLNEFHARLERRGMTSPSNSVPASNNNSGIFTSLSSPAIAITDISSAFAAARQDYAKLQQTHNDSAAGTAARTARNSALESIITPSSPAANIETETEIDPQIQQQLSKFHAELKRKGMTSPGNSGVKTPSSNGVNTLSPSNNGIKTPSINGIITPSSSAASADPPIQQAYSAAQQAQTKQQQKIKDSVDEYAALAAALAARTPRNNINCRFSDEEWETVEETDVWDWDWEAEASRWLDAWNV